MFTRKVSNDTNTKPLKRIHAINVDLLLYDDCLVIRTKGRLCNMPQASAERVLSFDEIAHLNDEDVIPLEGGLVVLTLREGEDAVSVVCVSSQEKYLRHLLRYIREKHEDSREPAGIG